jgi:hypothetical protein
LILVTRIEGEWFYTGEDAWILLIGGDGAKVRVAHIERALELLDEEVHDIPDKVDSRSRIVALLAAEAARR